LKFDVVIIGGGAAGLFCAIEAGKRGRSVLVIEKNSQVGRKIVISGGGRCNFTNIHTSPDNFISQNPHFCKSALARFTPEHFIELVKKHRIDFYEKTLGQLFCRESSRQIVDMLLKECERRKVEIRTLCSVADVERRDGFRLKTTIGDIECTNLVIASGGLSFAKVGATDFGYAVAAQFGLKIESTRPSLVPLVLESGSAKRELAGVSVSSSVTTRGQTFRENILFTHRGMSGPAVLQISNYWKQSEPVLIDLSPRFDAATLFESNRRSKRTLVKVLSDYLPERVAAMIAPEEFASTPLNRMTQNDLNFVAHRIHSWQVSFVDSEGYDKAEVTLGGVSTSELSSQTMEAIRVPGLFFIGEVVDVTGWLGGYNFQWAWASGYAAGRAV
jgi:predicted Rossmann fold flavoprotein